jgi:hypothetical protein
MPEYYPWMLAFADAVRGDGESSCGPILRRRRSCT